MLGGDSQMHGMARQARSGVARWGKVGLGLARQGRCGSQGGFYSFPGFLKSFK